MVIIMEMGAGRTYGEEPGRYGASYGDEVLNAGWAEVPRVEARLEEVVVSTRREPVKADIEGFMARLYACQE
jgi:hypothetical protein